MFEIITVNTLHKLLTYLLTYLLNINNSCIIPWRRRCSSRNVTWSWWSGAPETVSCDPLSPGTCPTRHAELSQCRQACMTQRQTLYTMSHSQPRAKQRFTGYPWVIPGFKNITNCSSISTASLTAGLLRSAVSIFLKPAFGNSSSKMWLYVTSYIHFP